ncbi:MAG: DUF3108 domain-containing protein [Rhodanobacteraceae bacterium]
MNAMQRFCKIGLILMLGTVCCTATAAAPVPAFTAHYRLLKDGSRIGSATLTLVRNDNGTWVLTTRSKGTAGLASLLGASIEETSTFQWVGDLPQGISYDYTLKSALKDKHRSVRFDWNTHTIEVNDHGMHRFATQPGALERHTVPLALAAGLANGQARFTLPVAVRDRVEMQHYVAHGRQSVGVPAGTFDAVRVSRTDGDDGFEAWFAPTKLPAPVKIEQRGKSNFSLELESWSTH